MGKSVSYSNFDYKPVDIIPVIASFDSDGHIAPLYVRIEGESYKIDSFWMSCNFQNIIEFKCKVICGDFLKPLLLTYYKHENVWTMPKEQT